MTSIVSYNVNGIRSAINKGLADWIRKVEPDLFCFQEMKANAEDVPASLLADGKYKGWFFPAEKKGYSGVGIISRTEPDHVEYGCGDNRYDREGRILRVDFPKFSLMNVYLPSGTTGDERQTFKEKFMADFSAYVTQVLSKKPNLIICGDFNICHQAIDIHNPISNKDSSGFLPHEREWLSSFLNIGFTDSFRALNPDPHHYTWWTFRAGARANNKGWRIDYHMVSNPLMPQVVSHHIHADAVHSDHCPIELKLNI